MVFNEKRVWMPFLFCVFFVFLFGGLAVSQNRLLVALLPFAARDDEKVFLGYLLRDLIKRELERYVEVYDVVLSDNLVRELGLSWDATLVPLTAQNLARKIGCSHLVSGSFRYRVVGGKERVVVSTRLFDIQKGTYVDIPSVVLEMEELPSFGGYALENMGPVLGISSFEAISFPFPLEGLMPLYEGVVSMDEALRTYGTSQYPDRPLWQKAFSLAQETIGRQPDYPEAYYYLACMYRATKWWAKEVETWERYLEKLKTAYGVSALPVAQAYFRLAFFCLSQKRLDEALSYVERAAELAPSWAEVYLLWGKIWYEKEDMEKAEDFFKKALELDSSLKEARYFAQMAEKGRMFGKSAYEAYVRGYEYFTQRNFKKAADSFREATLSNPKMKEAYYWLGRSLYELGDLDGSESAWERLLEIDPLHAQAQRFLERTRREKKYGREAVKTFEEGYRLYEEARYGEAASCFERAVALSPFFSEAHDYLARCYYRMGKKEAYVEERKKAAFSASQPREKAWQYYEVGLELFGWGDKAEAQKMLEEAVKSDPSLGGAHLALGEIYAEEGAWLKALEHYRAASQCVEEGEEKGKVLWGMATSFYALGRYGDALPLLEEIVREYPYSDFIEEVEALRVEVLVREGKNREVEKAFQQFVIRFPQSSSLEKTAFFYALALYNEKDWDRAKIALESFLERYPQSVFISQVKEMLGYTYRALDNEEEAGKYFAQLEGEKGEFLSADSLYRRRDLKGAEIAFRGYLTKYPEGKFAMEASLRLASLYLETGRIKEAEETMVNRESALLELFPANFLRLKARISHKKGDWKGVVDNLSLLEKKVGKLDREYLLLLALAYERLGEGEKAREVLREAGEKPEEILESPARKRLKEALTSVERGQYSEAVAFLEALKNEELTSEESQVRLFLLGKSYYYLNRLEDAHSCLKDCLNFPEDLRQEALLYLVDIAYRTEAWGEVIQWGGLLEKEGKASAPTLWRMALAYYRLGASQESITVLERIRGQGKWDEQARLLLLEELYALRDYTAFLSEAEAFLSLYPEHPKVQEILALLAWAAYFSQNVDKAKSTIIAYEERFPHGEHKSELLSLLVNIFLGEDDLEGALGVLQKLESEVTSPSELLPLWYKVGSAFLKKERFEEACPLFQKIFDAGESEFFTRGGYWLGVCLEHLERYEEALSVYKTLEKGEEGDEWVLRAKERIAVLMRE
ncbi:MAG: tetratricopeptide repeat protein [Candidatus Caldatribacteriaceae bacterium]